MEREEGARRHDERGRGSNDGAGTAAAQAAVSGGGAAGDEDHERRRRTERVSAAAHRASGCRRRSERARCGSNLDSDSKSDGRGDGTVCEPDVRDRGAGAELWARRMSAPEALVRCSLRCGDHVQGVCARAYGTGAGWRWDRCGPTGFGSVPAALVLVRGA